jgi:hypothetical protein
MQIDTQNEVLDQVSYKSRKIAVQVAREVAKVEAKQ